MSSFDVGLPLEYPAALYCKDIWWVGDPDLPERRFQPACLQVSVVITYLNLSSWTIFVP